MAINDKFYTGTTVSRHLPAGERSWDEVVTESGKPLLDSEVNLLQEVRDLADELILHRTVPSGWLRGPTHLADNFGGQGEGPAGMAFPPPGNPFFQVNSFLMQKRTAIVAGMPVVVEYTNAVNPTVNRINLDAAPLFGGAPPDVKRTDFVFLEVWRALVANSPNATAVIDVTGNPVGAGDAFNIAGNVLVGVLGAPGIDQFQVGGSASATAANIAAAINFSPPNSFTNVTASATGTLVTIRALVSGTAGNALVFNQVAALGGGTYILTPGTGFFGGGVDTANKPTQDTIYRHGNVDADPTVNLPDDIADPVVGTTTSYRVQVQYRIRVTGQSEAVNFKTEQDGFSNANIEAQGPNVAAVAGYPFVRADNSTVSGSSDATAYGMTDPGLWIAGAGDSSSAAALGTVDGFIYAIPIAFVFRRNDAYNGGAGNGWSPLDNTNGALPETHALFANPVVGSIPANTSDRPDGLFHDAIVSTDVLDLRYHVSPSGVDWNSELDYQLQRLMDGTLETWAIDAADKQDLGAGAGDVSYRNLVCNEVGRGGGVGGVPPASGDTTRGVSIANFDHVRRRFADQPVVEYRCFPVLPTDRAGGGSPQPGKYVAPANGGYTGWAEDDVIHIDLGTLNASGLGDWDHANRTLFAGATSVSAFWPPGTVISNWFATHDDGHHATAVAQDVQAKLVTGIGTDYIQITLDGNNDTVNGGDNGTADYRMVGDSGSDDGSPRRIFVVLEITYPIGSGTTDTPDEELTPDSTVYPEGPILENDISQRPLDWEALTPVKFREGKREITVEYVAGLPDLSPPTSGAPITDTFVSNDTTDIILARRIYGSATTVTTINDISTAGGGAPHAVSNLQTEWGSSSRRLVSTTPFSGTGQTLVSVTYFAQDPLPNYGAAGGGYQVAAYFRTNAPQTVGSKAAGVSLPDPFDVIPITVPKEVWTGTVGPGSADVPFPYTVPMDQIPVNGDIPPSTFPGEWYFASSAQISVDDFNAETGLLNLHSMVQVDGTSGLALANADIDNEFRAHFKASDTGAYRPTAMAQALSNVQRHKVWAAMLCRVAGDHELWRRGEIIMVVISRFAQLDDENTIRFTDLDNVFAAGIYRLRGRPVVASEF
jgi:hypothetical protein